MKWFDNNGHLFNIVHLSKIMEGARYCGNRYGSSIPKRFGSHQMSHSIGIWPTTKIITWTFQRMDSYRQSYMDVYMPHNAHKAIGKLRVSSHQPEIKGRRNTRIPTAERFCKLCEKEILWGAILCISAQLSTTLQRSMQSSTRTPPSNKWWRRLINDSLAKCWSRFRSMGDQHLQ